MKIEFDRPIAIAVTLFVILLMIFFLVAPKYQEFKALRQQIGEKQAAYDAKFAYYSEIAKVYDQIMAKKDIVDKIDNAIPYNVSYGPLVYFFQKKGLENGLIVRGLSLSKSSAINPESDIKEIVFSLDILGGYSALKSFMASLEKSARLFEIDDISFGSSVLAQTAIISSIASKTSLKTATVQPQILDTYPFKLEVKTYSY
ncbi:MAG: hypothetical protein AAB509_03410 [Patescibacteria group bacterium]